MPDQFVLLQRTVASHVVTLCPYLKKNSIHMLFIHRLEIISSEILDVATAQHVCSLHGSSLLLAPENALLWVVLIIRSGLSHI